jgi:hypothetical protein
LAVLVTTAPHPINWLAIAQCFVGKTETQVVGRWAKVLDPSLLNGSWTRLEDETIVKFVAQYGTKSWARLSELLPGRVGKQCRDRWVNALDPSLSREPWTAEEDKLLVELHGKFGNCWAKIGEVMQTRSDNSIKNRWNSTLSKRSEAPAQAAHRKAPLPSISLLTMCGRMQPSDIGSLSTGEGALMNLENQH